VRVSPIYETEPVGVSDQPLFLNLVAEVETRLSPQEVMEVALGVERRVGRVRLEPGCPRTLDVDLLLDGDLVLAEEALKVPHPRLHLRRFVLAPLADLAPDLLHPVAGKTVAGLLADCPDTAGLWPYAGGPGFRLACGLRDGRSIMDTSP
jgi:2-amino-4-hydroxy-6-hydroxymethyldihydropteridine diphosphokinase